MKCFVYVAENKRDHLDSQIIQEETPKNYRSNAKFSRLGPCTPSGAWAALDPCLILDPPLPPPLPDLVRPCVPFRPTPTKSKTDPAKQSGAREVTAEWDQVYFVGRGLRNLSVSVWLTGVLLLSERTTTEEDWGIISQFAQNTYIPHGMQPRSHILSKLEKIQYL